MINIFSKVIDPQKILAMQNLQYQEKLLLEDTVPKNTSKLGKVSVSSLGHFYCLYITGHFSTLYQQEENGADVVDDGVSHLRGKLSDGSNQRQLFNDYIPLDLVLTPGRVKATATNFVLATGTAALAAPSNNLFYPQVFQYMFTVNSDILFDVKNDSNYANTYAVVFHGIRLPEARRGKSKR